MTTSVSFDWIAEEGQRLAECKHDHPFALLGPHLHEDKWLVRAWIPEATEVVLHLDGGNTSMTNPHHPWLFEAALDKNPGKTYRLKVKRGDIGHEQFDPWAFRDEWMGEMDRHLFAEGNHHHIWQRMGAHLIDRNGIEGVMFCIWALGGSRWLENYLQRRGNFFHTRQSHPQIF